MAAPQPPTLGQLRNSVAIRAALARSGTLLTTVQPTIDEAINSAQRKIFLRAAWARQLVTEEITTVDEQRDYDLPVAAGYVGDVQQLLLVNASGTRFRLRYDDSERLTSNETWAATKGRPTTWAYIDDVMRMDKAIDATAYPRIVAEVMKSDETLVKEGDRACVDGEALVMLATITVKRLMGIDFDLDKEMSEYVLYLKDLRANRVGPGRAFAIASQLPTGVPYWGINAALYRGPTDWNPDLGAGW
jgi:hypothetical protein